MTSLVLPGVSCLQEAVYSRYEVDGWQKRVRPLEETLHPLHSKLIERGDQVSGDLLLRRLRDRLQSLEFGPWTRSEDQKRFHEMYLNAIAPRLYGLDTFNREFARILRENNWTSTRSQSMIVTPRRWGKTVCTCMFIAAVLMEVPRIRVCVYSPGRRASDYVRDLTYEFISHFPDMNVRKSGERVLVSRTSEDVRKLFSYPSNPKIGFGKRVSMFCGVCVWGLPVLVCRSSSSSGGQGKLMSFVRLRRA